MARQPGPDPERTSYGSFCSFNDPDGNTWLVQEVTTRRPGVRDGIRIQGGPGQRDPGVPGRRRASTTSAPSS